MLLNFPINPFCMDKRLKELNESLMNAIEEETLGIKKTAVLFSGGIDSSLIAFLVSKKIPVKLYAVGLKESNAIKSSERAANLLNLPLKKVIVQKKEIPKHLSKTKSILKTNNFLQLSIALPEFIALKQIKADKFTHVFCGQGADELFFGYDEFRRLLEEKNSFKELEKLREKKLANIFKDNLKRDLAIANHFSLKLHTPFLNNSFKKSALSFSAKENISSEKDFLRKRILRKLAEEFLPKELALKKKKAIQYDSSLAKELKKLINN